MWTVSPVSQTHLYLSNILLGGWIQEVKGVTVPRCIRMPSSYCSVFSLCTRLGNHLPFSFVLGPFNAILLVISRLNFLLIVPSVPHKLDVPIIRKSLQSINTCSPRSGILNANGNFEKFSKPFSFRPCNDVSTSQMR